MKKVLFFLMVLFFAANVFAQNGNDRISYQAVVRNSDNRLVYNENLTVTVTITNVPGGPVVYSETHNVTSNANGLVSLLVGNGTEHTGNWNDIQWKTAQLFTRIVKAGTQELLAEQDMPLTAVPYALYADSAANVNPAAIAQQIHDTASALRGLIKDTDDRFGNYYTKPQADDLLGAKADTAILAKVAKTGSYSDLGDKPEINNATLTLKQGDDTLGTFTANASANQDIEIPAVPANVSAFINDAGYLTSYTETQTLADVTAAGNSAGNRQLKNVSDPTDAQDAVTESYLAAQLGALASSFQHQLDSLGGVIEAQQRLLDSLINGGTTPPTPAAPTATTSPATDTTQTSATLNGTVSNPGNVPVTAQGFEWKATTGGTYTAVDATGATMTYSLTGLTASTSYTYRAFVTTASGTSYGEEVTFTTLSAGGTAVIDDKSCPEAPTVTDHEGNVYATVKIGGQCWMRDNLRTTTSPSTGTYLVPAADADITYTGKQARWYGNDSATCVTNNYGLLYNWNAAVDTFNTAKGETSVNDDESNAVSVTFTGHRRGICPAGWHLPSHAEWTAMEGYVGSQSEYTCGISSYIAKVLASTEGWNTSSGNCTVGNDLAANNATGFSAVPAGLCYGSSFHYAGSHAYFWSATQNEDDPYLAYYRNLYYDYTYVFMYYDSKYSGLSVRCLRDENGGAAQEPTATTSPATAITATSATLNGTVSNPGNVAVTAQGFEWKATTGGTYTTVDATGETMTYSLTGLTANTGYTYRAFVTTASGTNYGDEETFTTASAPVFTCGTSTVTDHEGNVYATVKIGGQCWMRDNLRTTTSPSTGTYLVPAADANYTYTGKQARWYGNDSATCVTNNYGLLYNWNAAVDTFNTAYGETSVNTSSGNAVSVTFTGHRRGICPAGWHLPSDAEWTTMTDYVGSQSEYTCGSNNVNIAKALASTTGWSSSTNPCAVGNDLAANNATVFSAVPVGICIGSSFYQAGYNAAFWSATQGESNPDDAYGRDLLYYTAYVGRYGNNDKNAGFSVRCLRD